MHAGRHRRRFRRLGGRLALPLEAPKLIDVATLGAVDVAIGDGIGVEDETRVAVQTLHLYADVATPRRIAVRFEGETRTRRVLLKRGIYKGLIWLIPGVIKVI